MDILDRLSGALSKLPGVGRRSAERMAAKLVRDRNGVMQELIGALDEAKKGLRSCKKCGSITSVSADPCALCTDESRDGKTVCVVDDPSDIEIIESSGGFRGRYHSLMGRIAPMKGVGPENLRVKDLVSRVDAEGFTEVILALGNDVEGDSTASFLADILKKKGVKVTRLAYGLPAGSRVMHADALTLSRAIKGRTEE